MARIYLIFINLTFCISLLFVRTKMNKNLATAFLNALHKLFWACGLKGGVAHKVQIYFFLHLTDNRQQFSAHCVCWCCCTKESREFFNWEIADGEDKWKMSENNFNCEKTLRWWSQGHCSNSTIYNISKKYCPIIDLLAKIYKCVLN